MRSHNGISCLASFLGLVTTLLTPENISLFQTFPFFGVLPVLLDENGKEIHGAGEGYLVFRRPWPGIMRTLFGNHERFETTYFKKFPGFYCTGDGKGHESSVPVSGGIYTYVTVHQIKV
jgi:acyl-coenzyme A synthetase/AMP-(fatty) acid ligase